MIVGALMLGCGGALAAGPLEAIEHPEAVVVTATRTEREITDVPASVTVIDRETIRTSGAASVDELFRALVGVDLQGSGLPGSAVRLNLRGLTPGYQSERILVLVDGRRVNDAYQGNAEFALLPPDDVERIEVLRGPASALYGSNAMGGVINIVTRRGAPQPVGELKAEAGSFQTVILRAAHGWQRGPLDYFVTAGRTATEGYARNTDGTRRDWSAWNWTGNCGWDPGGDAELRFSAGLYEGAGTDENSERDVRKDYQTGLYRLRWQASRAAELTVRLSRTGQHDVYDWKYPGEGLYRQESLGAEVQQVLWVADRHFGTAGADVRQDRVDIDEVSGAIAESAIAAGAYVQDEIYASERLAVTLGARGDRDEDYGSEWSPRAGMLWRLSEAAELYGSVARAYRAPALSDRYVKVVYNGMLFLGNPDLKPETLTVYEAGLRLRTAERLKVELALFLNDMEDSFDFMLGPDGVFRNRNATRSRTRGVECGAEWQLAAALSVFANYAYTEGTYEEGPTPDVEGKRLAYLAPHKAAAGIEYHGPDGRAAHALSGRFADARYGDAQNTPRHQMDAYATLDWRSRWRLRDGLVVTLRVNNLLDETYQEFPGVDQAGRAVFGGVELAL